jgi:hypothetical protein
MAFVNPQAVLLAAFSRPLSRCDPLLLRAPLLCLWCVDGTSSAQPTMCVIALHLPTWCREDARKSRGAAGNQLVLPALLLPERSRAASEEQYLHRYTTSYSRRYWTGSIRRQLGACGSIRLDVLLKPEKRMNAFARSSNLMRGKTMGNVCFPPIRGA